MASSRGGRSGRPPSSTQKKLTALANALPVDQIHHLFRVSQARCCAGGKHFIQAAHIFRTQLHINSGGVFLKLLAALCSGDGNNVITLR